MSGADRPFSNFSDFGIDPLSLSAKDNERLGDLMEDNDRLAVEVRLFRSRVQMPDACTHCQNRVLLQRRSPCCELPNHWCPTRCLARIRCIHCSQRWRSLLC